MSFFDVKRIASGPALREAKVPRVQHQIESGPETPLLHGPILDVNGPLIIKSLPGLHHALNILKESELQRRMAVYELDEGVIPLSSGRFLVRERFRVSALRRQASAGIPQYNANNLNQNAFIGELYTPIQPQSIRSF